MMNNFKNELVDILTSLLSEKEHENVTPICLDTETQNVFIATFTDRYTLDTEILGAFTSSPLNNITDCFVDDEMIEDIEHVSKTLVKVYTNFGVYQIRETLLI